MLILIQRILYTVLIWQMYCQNMYMIFLKEFNILKLNEWYLFMLIIDHQIERFSKFNRRKYWTNSNEYYQITNESFPFIILYLIVHFIIHNFQINLLLYDFSNFVKKSAYKFFRIFLTSNFNEISPQPTLINSRN